MYLKIGKLLCSPGLQGQYSQQIKARQHITNCLPQRDCQHIIKIDALLTSVRRRK